MSTALLTLPPLALCRLWGELVEAYHGLHSYGGHVAELYAYRFYTYDSLVDLDVIPHQALPYQHALAKRRQTAADRLAALCLLFRSEYRCQVQINGLSPDEWRRQAGDTFLSRVSVDVQPTEAQPEIL